jgi:hypothetical protein
MFSVQYVRFPLKQLTTILHVQNFTDLTALKLFQLLRAPTVYPEYAVAKQLLYCIPDTDPVLTYIFHVLTIRAHVIDDGVLSIKATYPLLETAATSILPTDDTEATSCIGVYVTHPEFTLPVLSNIIHNISHFS